MAGGGGLGKPCILLIVIAGMERFAFKGVSSNLVTYLTDVMKMSNSAAAKVVNTWCGFTFIMPLFVAPFTACFWDHYFTILTFSLFYVGGLAAVTSTAIDWPWLPKASKAGAGSSLILLSSLFIISFAQGGYNPSLQAFGADQLGEDEDGLPCNQTEKSTNKKSLFFTWWYFGVCSGSLLGLSIMSYIQDTISWSLGFGIPAVVMICSIALFSSGSRFYIHDHNSEMATRSGDVDHHHHRRAPLDQKWSCCLKEKLCKVFNHRNAGGGGGGEDTRPQDIELELQGKPLCETAAKQAEGEDTSRSRTKSPIIPIENAKVVLRLLPIWTMLLVFAVIFQQPPTFFTKQGTTMKRNIGTKFMIPPATLQGAINVSVLLMMPFYDKIVVPLARRITKDARGMTVMQRMGSGMLLSTLAMIIAALVEERRLDFSRKMEHSGDHVPLSIFWLLPQYMLLGFSDIFTVVGMQEFFYCEVPVKMKTVGIALCTSVFGVGSFLSALMISVIETITSCGGKKPSWFSDDMGQARLDKFYWLLAVGSGASLFIYVILCRFYKSVHDLATDCTN